MRSSVNRHSHPGPHRRLPAYAADLVAQRRLGFAPQADLLIACDWKLSRAWAPWRIVVAPNEPPAAFDFSVCAGLSCLVVGRTEERVNEVAQAVNGYLPLRLIGVAYRPARIAAYRPSVRAEERG